MYRQEQDRRRRDGQIRAGRKLAKRRKIYRMCRALSVPLAAAALWLGGVATLCRVFGGEAGSPTREASQSLYVRQDASYTERVECIFQNPELPTGCEATAGTMLLRAYGYKAEKTRTAELLEKGDRIVTADGAVYAPDPDEAFVGDPAGTDGYGVFAGALAEAMQQVIDRQGGGHTAKALYGSDEESILAYIDRGIPLCVWTSMGDQDIEWKSGWYLIKDGEFTEEFFCWPSGEHCVVLTGYDEDTVTVCDPLEGECTYPRDSFFLHYEQVGSYALVLES